VNRCSFQNIRFADPGTNVDGLSVTERTEGECSESEGVMGARKDDRRVQRTQQLLRTAVVSLIEENGFESLTVQDIIDRANVGRATFYAHFDNKEDLLVSGFEGLRAALKELQRQAHMGTVSPDERLFAFSHEMFAHIAEYRKVFRATIAEDRGGSRARRSQGYGRTTGRKLSSAGGGCPVRHGWLLRPSNVVGHRETPAFRG